MGSLKQIVSIYFQWIFEINSKVSCLGLAAQREANWKVDINFVCKWKPNRSFSNVKRKILRFPSSKAAFSNKSIIRN